MNKNIPLILISMVLLVGIIGVGSAEVSIGGVAQGHSINLTQICSNCTYVNLTSVIYPNNTYSLLGQYSMTKNGENFYYSFTDTTALGDYIYTTCGDLNGINTCQSVNFKVTPSGFEMTSAQSLMYLILFGIIFFVFGMNIFFINKLPNMNNRDDEGKLISINYLKYLRSALWFVEYILFVAVLYISSNLAFYYLGEQLFAKTLFVLYRVVFSMAPIIVLIWIAWIFVKIKDDKGLQKMLSRGIFPQGRL